MVSFSLRLIYHHKHWIWSWVCPIFWFKRCRKKKKALSFPRIEPKLLVHTACNVACELTELSHQKLIFKKILRGFSPQANYTDRATAACRRSYCQLLRIEGVALSVQRTPTAVNLGFLGPELLSYTHEAEWTPFQTHYSSENLVEPRTERRTTGSVARNSGH
jgi:hypothetical protein